MKDSLMKFKNFIWRNKGKILMYSILIFYAVVTLYPFIFSLSASFKTNNEILTSNSIIPKQFSIEGWKKLFSVGGDLFPRWIFNTFFIAIMTALLNVILNSMAGYALARLEFPGKKQFFYAVLVILMVPGQVLIIPNYIVMRNLGILNTYAAVIIPGAINASFIFMMRQFYLNFPKELEEAAKIDGLSYFGIFRKVVIPLSLPSLGTMFLFTFLGSWNNFMSAKLYITSKELYVLSQGLASLEGQFGGVDWARSMAGSIFTIIPILILYIILNKYFIKANDISGGK